MQFCPKCSAMLIPKKVKKQRILSCPSCKYTDKKREVGALTENIEKQEEVSVVDQNQDIETLPEIEEECPECHHTKGRYWMIQTRASDEAPTKFIKCEKCGHTWRDYS